MLVYQAPNHPLNNSSFHHKPAILGYPSPGHFSEYFLRLSRSGSFSLFSLSNSLGPRKSREIQWKICQKVWKTHGKTMENIGKRCCNHWKTRIEDSNGLGSRGKCARKNLGKIRILQIAAHSVAEQFRNWGENWARNTCLNHLKSSSEKWVTLSARIINRDVISSRKRASDIAGSYLSCPPVA